MLDAWEITVKLVLGETNTHSKVHHTEVVHHLKCSLIRRDHLLHWISIKVAIIHSAFAHPLPSCLEGPRRCTTRGRVSSASRSHVSMYLTPRNINASVARPWCTTRRILTHAPASFVHALSLSYLGLREFALPLTQSQGTTFFAACCRHRSSLLHIRARPESVIPFRVVFLFLFWFNLRVESCQLV